MKNDELIWFLFDFDDVITSGYRKGNKNVYTFIEILTIRKNEKLTFQESCHKLGLHPDTMAQLYAESALPNLKIRPILRLFSLWKRIGKPYRCGIASNNSDYLIYHWLKFHKLENPFSRIFTPEKFNWVRKPDREYFTKCIESSVRISCFFIFYFSISNIK